MNRLIDKLYPIIKKKKKKRVSITIKLNGFYKFNFEAERDIKSLRGMGAGKEAKIKIFTVAASN